VYLVIIVERGGLDGVLGGHGVEEVAGKGLRVEGERVGDGGCALGFAFATGGGAGIGAEAEGGAVLAEGVTPPYNVVLALGVGDPGHVEWFGELLLEIGSGVYGGSCRSFVEGL